MPLPRCRQPLTVIGAPSWPLISPLSRSTSAALWRLQAAPVSATARPQLAMNDLVHIEFIRFLLSLLTSSDSAVHVMCRRDTPVQSGCLDEDHVPWMTLASIRAILAACLLGTVLSAWTFAQDVPQPTI